VTFLDIADAQRKGRLVTFTLLEVTPAPSAGSSFFSVFRVQDNCSTKSFRSVGVRAFDANGAPRGWARNDEDEFKPWDSSNSSGAAAILACEKPLPTQTVSGADEALKFARSIP
jgi:hypothetical protein